MLGEDDLLAVLVPTAYSPSIAPMCGFHTICIFFGSPGAPWEPPGAARTYVGKLVGHLVGSRGGFVGHFVGHLVGHLVGSKGGIRGPLSGQYGRD